jgi:hypothetical protein
MAALPGGAAANAAAGFHCKQKLMLQQWVIAGQQIPGDPIDFAQ